MLAHKAYACAEGSRQGAVHHEIGQHHESTSKARHKVLQALIVQRYLEERIAGYQGGVRGRLKVVLCDMCPQGLPDSRLCGLGSTDQGLQLLAQLPLLRLMLQLNGHLDRHVPAALPPAYHMVSQSGNCIKGLDILPETCPAPPWGAGKWSPSWQ